MSEVGIRGVGDIVRILRWRCLIGSWFCSLMLSGEVELRS